MIELQCIDVAEHCTFTPFTWALKHLRSILDNFYTGFSSELKIIGSFLEQFLCELSLCAPGACLPDIWKWLCMISPSSELSLLSHGRSTSARRDPQHSKVWAAPCRNITSVVSIPLQFPFHCCFTFCRAVWEMTARWIWPRFSEVSILCLWSVGCSWGRRTFKYENMAQWL